MAKVLVVDDDSHFRGILERIILRNYTYSVKSVANEEEAWEEFSKDTYDLVLLDLYIDGKKSWDTLKRIKAMPSAPAVIMISCENLAENAEHAKALGAADFVPKPIDFGRLKGSIDRALDRRRESLLSPSREDREKDQEIAREVRLLVLVPEESRREVLEAFDAPGFRVFETKDPADAAETAKRETLDAVVVGGAAGICPSTNMVRVLREREGEGLRLPVIALAGPDPDAILAALKAGVDDYIAFPLDRRVLAGKVAAHVRQRRAYERRLAKAVEGAVIDPLTEAYNDAYFLSRLAEEIRRSQRHGRSMALAIIGLGGAGEERIPPVVPGRDRILSDVSRALRFGFRNSDILGRWGENGFAVILPEATADRILPRAGAIRAGVEERLAALREGERNVLCFMGLASLPSGSPGASPDGASFSPGDLVAMASDALERAVSSGRGGVAVFGERGPSDSGTAH